MSAGKSVPRHLLERPAAQDGAPRRVRPVEVARNCRKGHLTTTIDTDMDIIGSGLDAIEIGRVAEAVKRYGDRFIRRLFTAGEQAYCQGKRDAASSFAARFAAKEAAMKALGTGYSRGVHWIGIEVVRRHGPPQLHFHDGAARRFTA